MPRRLKKPCSYPGCPELVSAGKTYCEKHKKQIKSNRDKQYNQYKRDPKSRKFYSSRRWRNLRNLKIRKDPICEYCLEKDRLTPATEVDHIIPIEIDWSKRLDQDNLKSSCHPCHMKKTLEDKKKYNNLQQGEGGSNL